MKWEYMVLFREIVDGQIAGLNELGADGWEVVGFSVEHYAALNPDEDGTVEATMLLKRRLVETAAGDSKWSSEL